jgi:hypothetical protein
MNNSAHPDDLDDLERKYLAANHYFKQDVDEQQILEFDSDFSLDNEETNDMEFEDAIGHLEQTAVVDDPGSWSNILTQQREKNNTGGKGVSFLISTFLIYLTI